MKTTRKKLVIIQTAVPDYRNNLYTHLKSKLKNGFSLYSGENYFEKSVMSDSRLLFYKKTKNIFLFNRKLMFQIGFWNEVFKNNVLVLEMNPRIISNWIVLILRKIINKKTVLWGHAWPRAGVNSKTDVLRGFMRRLASQIIVYTATQKKELQCKMPNSIILFAPNSVFFAKDMAVTNNKNDIKNIIYVGRLTTAKKPLLLVKAFHKVIDKIPETTQLIIVGDGYEKQNINNYIEVNNLKNRILTLGHVSDYNELKKLYNKSVFSVSPGYVGLSITQSFGFGVPMLISNNETHSPEIEAAKEGENALFFNTDNLESLGKQIISFLNNNEWIEKREQIMTFCKNNYSIEVMAQTFESLLTA